MKKNQVEEIKTELQKISNETAKKLQFISALYNAYNKDAKSVKESSENIQSKTSLLIHALMEEKDALIDLKLYRDNEPIAAHKIIKKRVKIC